MTLTAQDDLIAAQQEVQRRFGDCLLQLQHYELRLKRLLAASDVGHTLTGTDLIKTDSSEDLHRKSLGQLKDQLMRSFFTEGEEPIEEPEPEKAETTDVTITYRMRVALSKEDFRQTETDITELVNLRNHLVHHFLEERDLKTLEGCLEAQATLGTALERVAEAKAALSNLTKDLATTRDELAAFISSPEGQEFFVQGRLPWHRLPITQILAEAAAACRIDGWASVADAVAWMEAHHPDEKPAAYDLKSWPQVIHETRLFELRRLPRDGELQPCYRIRGDGQDQAS